MFSTTSHIASTIITNSMAVSVEAVRRGLKDNTWKMNFPLNIISDVSGVSTVVDLFLMVTLRLTANHTAKEMPGAEYNSLTLL
jgi:hypothetical protein